MSIYKNQAQRVFDHIQANGGMEILNASFSISVDRIESAIEKAVKKSGINGKKAADTLILFWDMQKK